MATVPERLVVLLAADDPNDTVLIRRAITQIRGLSRILELRDGAQVLSCLRGEGIFSDRTAWPMPRLIVLDQWLSNLSAVEVLQAMRSDPRLLSVPVVVLTEGISSMQAEAYCAFRSACCPKTFTTKTLKPSLEAAIGLALRLVWQTPGMFSSPRFTPESTGGMALRQTPQCVQRQREPRAI